MLLGATLVAIGVLAAAVADRIRGLRVLRETLARVQALEGELFIPTRSRPTTSASSAPLASVVTPANIVPPVEALRPTKPHATRPSTDGAEDVVAALVAAGYKKQIATDAALACSGAERATIEDWTRAALRRCAREVS
jgi:hypothetical protein